MEAVVCHSVSHNVPLCIYIFMFSVVSHWSGLRSFSGFCHIITIGSSLELLPVILLFPCFIEILQLCIGRTGPFTCSNSSQMMKIWGWANSKPWIPDWVLAELVISLDLPYLHQKGQLSSVASAKPLNTATGRR